MKMNDLGGSDNDNDSGEDEDDMFGARMRTRDGGSNINQMVRRSAINESGQKPPV